MEPIYPKEFREDRQTAGEKRKLSRKNGMVSNCSLGDGTTRTASYTPKSRDLQRDINSREGKE